MATVTGIADSSGNFSIELGANYVSAEKITVTASKDGNSKSVELFAPSDPLGGGVISFSGTLVNFPVNIGTITLSGELVDIPDYAFAGSGTDASQNSLAKAAGLKISQGTKTIGKNCFQYWRNMKTVSLPNGLTSIGEYAFNSCMGINQPVVFPDSITSIGQLVMNNCTSCPGIIIGLGITVIPTNAFSTMTALTNAEFRGQVASMAGYSCNGWTNCNEIIMRATIPPTIITTTFASLKATCIFKVPAASVDAYKTAANWSAFASRIQAI